jgi:hypothetical protein
LSTEEDLLHLARDRDSQMEVALGAMPIEAPALLRRQLRQDLSRQIDSGRMKRTEDRVPELATVQGGLNELTCGGAEFSDGARLVFSIQLEKSQQGWQVKRFKFHLHLPPTRNIGMVRIHLNPGTWHDPVKIPRCHLHVGDSGAHIPFPIMNPRLILSLICEHIEPDFGIPAGRLVL